MQDQVIVIGGWEDPASRSLRLQNFVTNGETFIPIFSDEAAFERQVKGSGFEDDGLAIDRDLFLSILSGDELLILNPGDPDPVKMTKADLADVQGGSAEGSSCTRSGCLAGLGDVTSGDRRDMGKAPVGCGPQTG